MDSAQSFELLQAEKRKSQMLRSGSSYLSQSERILTFGLGSRTQADAVEIRWPSGQVDRMTNVKAGGCRGQRKMKRTIRRIRLVRFVRLVSLCFQPAQTATAATGPAARHSPEQPRRRLHESGASRRSPSDVPPRRDTRSDLFLRRD